MRRLGLCSEVTQRLHTAPLAAANECSRRRGRRQSLQGNGAETRGCHLGYRLPRSRQAGRDMKVPQRPPRQGRPEQRARMPWPGRHRSGTRLTHLCSGAQQMFCPCSVHPCSGGGRPGPSSATGCASPSLPITPRLAIVTKLPRPKEFKQAPRGHPGSLFSALPTSRTASPQTRQQRLRGSAPWARLPDKQSHLGGSGIFSEHLKLLFLHLTAQCQPQFMLFVHLLREHYLISHPVRRWGRGFSFSLSLQQVGHQGIQANILGNKLPSRVCETALGRVRAQAGMARDKRKPRGAGICPAQHQLQLSWFPRGSKEQDTAWHC